MRVTVVHPSELGEDEAGLWVKFQHAWPTTLKPFLSLTFAQAVGRARPAARVAVVEEDNHIEAFLAFELGSRGSAIPIGWPMSDLQALVTSGAPLDARSVVRGAGLRSWRFDHAPAEQVALMPHHYPGTTIDCPVIDLSDGYQAFFREVTSRGKSLLSKSPKQRSAIERQLGRVSLEWHSGRRRDLYQMIEWKSTKYDGTRDLFADPTAVRIVEELADSVNLDCHGKISVLVAGEQPIAIDLGLVGPTDLCGWFTGYDPGLRRFSPGTMMLLALAEEAANQGIPRFDLGYGQHRYKFTMANGSYPLAGGIVWAHRGEASARALYRRLMLGPFLRSRLSRRHVASEPESVP